VRKPIVVQRGVKSPVTRNEVNVALTIRCRACSRCPDRPIRAIWRYVQNGEEEDLTLPSARDVRELAEDKMPGELRSLKEKGWAKGVISGARLYGPVGRPALARESRGD